MRFKIDRLVRLVARGLMKLPKPVISLLAGKPKHIDGQTLDPYVQLMLRLSSEKPGHLASVEETRHGFDLQGDWMTHSPAPNIERSSLVFDSGVACEMHVPATLKQQTLPVILFFHGGGHVGGSLVSHRSVCRQLAADVECRVIAVDYRLAPEHPFPVGINDSLEAFDEVVKRADELRIDPDRIAVAGDSAGGNVAAVVAQQRRNAEHPPKAQALWVPWLDMTKETESYELFELGYFLERPKMRWYTNHYLANKSDAENVMASPLLGDVEGVCTAGVFVAGCDPLRDEGLAYVEKLKAAKVKVDLHVYEGMVHPFINLGGCIPAANIAFKNAVIFFKENL